MVLMRLTRIVITETSDRQVIWLKEADGDRQFAIEISIYEAWAIERGVKEIRTARPLTHDLICSILASVGAEVERIVVTDIRDHTYYAKLVLLRDGRTVEVDSRPSDAIAIATQLGAPIYVEERVLEQGCKTAEEPG